MRRLRRRVLLAFATAPIFERTVRAAPGGEARAWRSARRYVAADPIATARALHAAGLRASIDLFGEHADAAAAPAVAVRYVELCARVADVPGAWLSLDLSHVAFDAGLLREIAAAVPPGRRLQVGAEETAVADRCSPPSWPSTRRASPSRRRSRPTCAARRATRSGSPTRASPSGS